MFNAFRRPAGIFAYTLGLFLVMSQASAALMIVDDIPVNFTDISASGSLVATAAIPEPTTLAMMGLSRYRL